MNMPLMFSAGINSCVGQALQTNLVAQSVGSEGKREREREGGGSICQEGINTEVRSAARACMTRHGAAWHGAVWHGAASCACGHGMALSGVERRGAAWHGVVCVCGRGMAWSGVGVKDAQ